jgi:FKBP12-rapamycin complex-associated protein
VAKTAMNLADRHQGPETLRETSFVQSFGHDLRAARDHCRRYKVHGDVGELNQAWDIYYAVRSFLRGDGPNLTLQDLPTFGEATQDLE